MQSAPRREALCQEKEESKGLVQRNPQSLEDQSSRAWGPFKEALPGAKELVKDFHRWGVPQMDVVPRQEPGSSPGLRYH